jgi:hypothetical protein
MKERAVPSFQPGGGKVLAAFFVIAAASLALPEPGSAVPQEPSLSLYNEGRWASPIREGFPEIPGGFTFCRLQYTVARNLPSGAGWSTDYPRGDVNLTMRLGELTSTWASEWENSDPGVAVVKADDPGLFRCPFLFASDPGSASFTEEEILALRTYLQKGGLLWVDDFWGETAWRFWAAEAVRILPDYDIVDMPMDHPLMSIVYQVDRIPQIPNIQFWRRSGGETSEFGAETAEPHMRAVFDDNGRLLLLMTHNTDIADGWEREADDDAFFLLFSPDAYAIGINVLIWTMTH